MSGSGGSGSIRSVLLLPPPPKIATTTTTTAATDGRVGNNTTTSSSTSTSSNSAGASNSTSNNNNNNHSSHETSSLDWKHRSSPITALVTVSHFDVAIRIVSAFRYMVTTYRSGSNKNHNDDDDDDKASSWQHFHVHLVPHHPDIALPPLVSVDPMVATTGEAMYRALLAIICHSSRDGATETDMTTTTTAVTTTVDHTITNTTTTPATDEPEPDTGDPLLLSEESPAVWEAVRKFREHLATLQGDKATKRHEKVSEALAAALPRVRQQLRAAVVVPPPLVLPLPSSSWPTTTTTSSTVPPPPPPPSYGAPPQPRGVSNQPAWMTQQQQQQSNVVAPTPEEPPTKRSKVDVTDPTLVFPLVPPDQIPALRQYTSQQIQQYLGEAEETLVTFCLNQMTSTTTTRNVATLLPELTEVLDDDAVAFVQSIYEYSQRLVTNSGMG